MTYSIIQAVTNNYDKIYDCLDMTADARILFTDQHQSVKNWEQRIIVPTPNCPWEDIFQFRWNPFDYVKTDYAIWIDGSIKINGSLKNYIQQMEETQCCFATLQHPQRNNIWDEYLEWIHTRNYPKGKAFLWMAYMEKNGWKPTNTGLFQVNVCIFKNTPIVKSFSHDVWKMLHLFDHEHAERLDQTVATYVYKHKYNNTLKLMLLSDAIYQRGMSLVHHGNHPNK